MDPAVLAHAISYHWGKEGAENLIPRPTIVPVPWGFPEAQAAHGGRTLLEKSSIYSHDTKEAHKRFFKHPVFKLPRIVGDDKHGMP